MRKSNFALRLQPSLLDEARQMAEAEGVALNQLINVAVAEKLSALRTRVSERMCKQVSVSLPYRGDSHDDQYDDYTGVAGSTSC
jgi:hypothetical protein